MTTQIFWDIQMFDASRLTGKIRDGIHDPTDGWVSNLG